MIVNQTVLVTGGCGFIGSHFVRLLRASRPEWRVVNLDKLTYAGNPDNLAGVTEGGHYRFVHGDIADNETVDALMQEESPWAIVNFAAESHVDRSIIDPAPFLQTNVGGTQTLLQAGARHKVSRFVQISTDEVYGDIDAPAVAEEGGPLRPSSPYAASKAAADLLCLAFHRTYAAPVLVVRSTNNYGPFQFPEKLIPLAIRNALAAEPVPVYGDGAQVRDWLYVEDNCAAILLILERGRVGEVYNVGTGASTTNIELIRLLLREVAAAEDADVAGLQGLIHHVQDRPGHDRRYALETSKLRRELGWLPRTLLPAGLQHTIQWYREHSEWVSRAMSPDYERYYDAVYRRQWRRVSS
jgi:dTDP-glucose 4,6-dehydratase